MSKQIIWLFFTLAVIPNVQISVGADWYGPGHMAIEDYIKYYYELPHSLEDLRSFIKHRLFSCDSTIYFSDAKKLLKVLDKKNTVYSYGVDSCYYKGNGEKGIFYSPDYVIRNNDLFQREASYFPVAFFSKTGERINYEDEDGVFVLISTVQKKYEHALCYKTNGRQCRVILEFRDQHLTPLRPFPDADELKGLKKAEVFLEETISDVSQQCVDYMEDIGKIMLDYLEIHHEVYRIVFPCLLMY